MPQLEEGKWRRVTIRVPEEEYAELERIAPYLPGGTPAKLVRYLLSEGLPTLSRMADAMRLAQQGKMEALDLVQQHMLAGMAQGQLAIGDLERARGDIRAKHEDSPEDRPG